jgi:hypothetical protein
MANGNYGLAPVDADSVIATNMETNETGVTNWGARTQVRAGWRTRMRQVLSITLVLLLLSPLASAQPRRTLKEQAMGISPGSVVEVRLVDKTKLRGRLGPVSDRGFELQTVKEGKIDTVQITFAQAKSINDTTKKSFGHSVGKGFLIAGIVIGAVIGIVAIVCVATQGCYSG